VEAYNIIDHDPSELRSCGCLETRDEVTHLCEAVNDYEYRIVSPGDGKVGDEIARNAFPRGGRNWEWRKFTVLFMPWCLAS